jgi:NAD(P)-dependent dehydrogenase (short-subunit alcohol dehydrogenase family)
MTKYLVITGGSGGIGRATITHFLQNNWSAINISDSLCDIPGVINFQIDLTEPEALFKFKDKLCSIVNNASTICLAHNAGFKVCDSIESISANDLRAVLNVNVISSILLNQILIPLMKPGSSILYTGSMLSDRGAPATASYSISKHAVLGLMRSTCQDLVGRGITTCCICPGIADTKLTHDTMDADLISHLLDTYVIGKRLIKPEEIAQVIYFCANSPVLNGALIPANLGLVAS